MVEDGFDDVDFNADEPAAVASDAANGKNSESMAIIGTRTILETT